MKKSKIIKICIIVGIVVSCLVLVAFKSIERNVHYIKTNYVADMSGQTFVIESKEQLDSYLNSNMEKFGLGHREKVYADSTIGFSDAIKNYDDSFFKSNNLIIVLLSESSGSITHEVTDVKNDEGILNINIKRNYPEIGTCDMTGWHIVVEVDKEPIDKINVLVDNMIINN